MQAQTRYPSLSAEDYAKWVGRHASTRIEASLYPGSNYQRLDEFLRLEGSQRYSPAQKHSFVYVYRDFGLGTDNGIPVQTPGQVDHHSGDQTSTDNSYKMLVLSGLPSAEWLRFLGGKYRVDPEFFQRHLDFFSTSGRRCYHSLPPLPSSSDFIIELRYFTLTGDGGKRTSLTRGAIHDKRTTAANRKERYINSVAAMLDRDKALGESMIRSVYVLDHGQAVIEQKISLCITETDTAIAWIDSGKDITEAALELLGGQQFSPSYFSSQDRVFLPTIQMRPFALLHNRPMAKDLDGIQEGGHKYRQSAQLLQSGYGQTLDRDLAEQDPFYAFHELFSFSAFSYSQFLNLIESNIATSSNTDGVSDFEADQSTFEYIQEILESNMLHLQETIEVINRREQSGWPRPLDPESFDKSVKKDCKLQRDYEALHSRANALSRRCSARIASLATKAQLAESKKAIDQSEKVTKLTKLAFVFIPLSFTSSCFGMNVSPLVQDAPPLWVWVVLSVGLLIICIVFMEWSPMDFLKRKIMNIMLQRAVKEIRITRNEN